MKRRVVCGLAHGRLCLPSLSFEQKVIEQVELRRKMIMLWTILVILLLLWLIGFYGGFVTSSLIHLLLVAAVVVLALNLFKSRSPA